MPTREGIIYSVSSPSLNKIYIGSTFKYGRRKAVHRQEKYNRCTSSEIIKQDDYEFNIIERYQCESKKQLLRREGTHQLNYNGGYDLVNKMIAGRTRAEYREHRKNFINEKFVCDKCGGKYTRTNHSHHIKSKKHTDDNKEN